MKTRLCLALAVLHAAACSSTTQSTQPASVPASAPTAAAATDPLPSWNDTQTKDAILSFVKSVTEEGSSTFVPEEARVAVFDNDGTLWTEQPVYAQLAFALDRVRALAPQHPEWNTIQPFKAVIEGDRKALAESGEDGLRQIVMVTHAGMSTVQFQRTVAAWLATAKHPKLGRPYTSMVYQPMLEVMRHLRENGFKTYIVSAGGIEFIRVFAEGVYGVAPERVVGSSLVTKYESEDGKPTIIREPEMLFVNERAGKPVAIQRHIGRRPIIAFGNSDGDFEMLEWTTSADGPRLAAIVRHTDGQREYMYDRGTKVGALDEALDAAPSNGWLVVDMKRDWNVVFPREERP